MKTMTTIERIIRVAKDQQLELAGVRCTDDYCVGGCTSDRSVGSCDICAARRSGSVIETLALQTAQHIEKLTQALQAVVRHTECTRNQSPNDCLVQCIADAKDALGISDTDSAKSTVMYNHRELK